METVQSLSDVSDLEGIAQASDVLNVSFQAYGSLIRSIVRNVAKGTWPRPLFDVVPFAGDIDLIHSGRSSETPKVIKALSDAVPLFRCFRWSVIAQDSIYVKQRRFNSVIPACDVFLSSDPYVGWTDRHNGTEQIQRDRYGFRRNDAYRESPLFKAEKDLELFSALIYFRVILESDARREFESMPGYESAVTVVQTFTEDVEILNRSDFLRRRLTYLMQSLVTNCPSTMLAARLIEQTGIQGLLRDGVPDQYERISSIWRAGNPVFISSTIDQYFQRVPFAAAEYLNAEDATTSLENTLNEYAENVVLENQRVIGGTSGINIFLGRAPSVKSAKVSPDEFIHLSIRHDPRVFRYEHERDSENLSLLLTVRIADQINNDLIGIFPVIALCTILEEEGHEQKIQFRLNVQDLFESISREYWNEPDVQVTAGFYAIVLEGGPTSDYVLIGQALMEMEPA